MRRLALLWGTWLTVQLSAVSMLLGLCVAVLGALGKTMGPKLAGIIDAYVEVIRNTRSWCSSSSSSSCRARHHAGQTRRPCWPWW